MTKEQEKGYEYLKKAAEEYKENFEESLKEEFSEVDDKIEVKRENDNIILNREVKALGTKTFRARAEVIKNKIKHIENIEIAKCAIAVFMVETDVMIRNYILEELKNIGDKN